MTSGSATDRVIVETACGAISGVRDGATGQCRFLGIPYAEPPVGSLRFKPTVRKRPWAGTLDASRFGPCSAQPYDPNEGLLEHFVDDPAAVEGRSIGSEDSLTLNVWTPGIDGARRPVLVWIHGGGNWLEGSRLPGYHGNRLAARGDVVFVSLNYRLGIFGFLDVSVLGGEAYRGSHSNGLRDQLAALDWVRETIAAFGGDPENVTLLGESAGSMDISWLLTTGRIAPPVRRAVMMSNVAGAAGLGRSGGLVRHSAEEGGRIARELLARLGFDSMAALLAAPTDRIIDRLAERADWKNILFDLDSAFYPCIDPDFAPCDPFRAAREGRAKPIDVMIGHTSFETGLWLLWDDELDQRPAGWAVERMRYFPQALGPELASRYARWFAEDVPGTLAMHVLNDAIFVMPTTWLAEELCRHNANVWMYRFDWPVDERHRAMHAAELPFLFDKQEIGTAVPAPAGDEHRRPARARLTGAMMDAVLAFARHGDPNRHANPALPHWPRYDTQSRAVMNLDADCAVLHDPAGERRDWWTRAVYAPAMG